MSKTPHSWPGAVGFKPSGPDGTPPPNSGAGPAEGAAASLAALPAAERDALVSAFRAVLQGGMHGLCFSAYTDGQSPGSKISEAQIRERLAIVQPHTRWVRTFSCTDGHEHIPRIAHELGLKTLVGAWLGTDAEINRRELDGVIEVARGGHADIVAVGNEVLLREDLSEDQLIAHLEEVRSALPGVPVGYVDAYYLFEKHPRVTAACDVILSNCYPFWEGCPRDQAVAYMRSMVQRAQAVAGGKPVIVSETGWPDRGSAFHGAVPSVEGAMRYFVDTFAWAAADGIDVFWFSSFDEAWKVGAEGDVGAFWGLWDHKGQPKFVSEA
jgi:exo-beta-1,3-glucanase (GH17 family)